MVGVVCGVAVVARRRSEGTHPINKTTRVTIEFNRERNGFQSAKRARGRAGGKGGDPRSKSPSTYAPLLFIVPNFHSQRTAIRRFANGRKRKNEREKWDRGKGGNGRKTVFANGSTEFVFFVEVNDTDFVSFIPGTIRKAQLRSRDRRETVGIERGLTSLGLYRAEIPLARTVRPQMKLKETAGLNVNKGNGGDIKLRKLPRFLYDNS